MRLLYTAAEKNRHRRMALCELLAKKRNLDEENGHSSGICYLSCREPVRNLRRPTVHDDYLELPLVRLGPRILKSTDKVLPSSCYLYAKVQILQSYQYSF